MGKAERRTDHGMDWVDNGLRQICYGPVRKEVNLAMLMD